MLAVMMSAVTKGRTTASRENPSKAVAARARKR
jgi:hypothetical protein